MLKAPTLIYSDQHISVFQNRPDRGAIICSKLCSKKFSNKKKGWKWYMPDKKAWQWCYMPDKWIILKI